MTKSELLAALPKLAHADLAAVHAMAEHLLGAAVAAQKQPASTLAPLLFEAMGAALCLTARHENMPDTVQAKLNKQIPLVEEFLAQTFPGKSKTALTALLRMLMELLKADLIRIEIKPTYNSMINNLHRLPDVFENSFPGYLESGLGHLVVDKFAKGVAAKPVRKRKTQVASPQKA